MNKFFLLIVGCSIILSVTLFSQIPTWQRLTTSKCQNIFFDSIGTYYLVKKIGVDKSTDGGITWVSTNYNSPVVSRLGSNTTEYGAGVVYQNKIFIASLDNGVWVSSDGGITWSISLNGGYGTQSFTIAKNNRALVANNSGSIRGMYKYNGQTTNWTQKLTSMDGRDIVTDKYGHIYAAFAGPALYKSTDDGETWSNIYTAPGNEALVWMEYNNNKLVLVTGTNKIFNSTDFGITWTQVGTFLGTLNPYLKSIGGDSLLASSYSEGIHFSSNFGATWTSLNTGLPTVKTNRINRYMDRAFAATDSGLYFISLTNQPVPTSGLVAYYPFNGNANDESGNGHNGTNHGALLTLDRFGSSNAAYNFAGGGERIIIPHSNQLNPSVDGLTISIWCNISSTNAVQEIICKGNDWLNDAYRFRYHNPSSYPGSGLGFSMRRFWSSNIVPSPSTNQWIHLVGVYDINDIKIYQDGVLITSTTITEPSTSFSNTSDLFIGQHDGASYPVGGKIDDIRIYNRALSESEIQALYQESASNTSPNEPQNLTATAGNSQITLKWNKNTETDFLKYKVYFGTDSTIMSLKDSSTASISDTTKTITGLTNGTKYYFRVSALDSAWLESGQSVAVSATPSDGLVAYYPFNSNANDESGNGKNGTNNGATLTTDRFGNPNKAYLFNGTNNYILLPTNSGSISGSTYLTFQVWVKPETYGGSTGVTVFNHWSTGNPTGSIGLQLGLYNFSLYAVQGSIINSTQDYPILNNWNQYIFVFKGDEPTPAQRVRLYINGSQVAINLYGQTIPQTIGTQSDLTALGAAYGSGHYWNYYKGGLDDIKIYNRVLSDIEIQTLYAEGGWTGNTAPNAPQNLIATAGNSQVTLKWNKNTETDFLKYKIYFGTDSTIMSLKDSSTTSIVDTSKTISGLTNGLIYYFKVTAVDSTEQESGFSNNVQIAPTIVADGLVAYYPFNNNANDGSGNANNGTVHDAVLTSDRTNISNNAYHFNGTSSYIQTANDAYTSNNFSMSVWVKPSVAASVPPEALTGGFGSNCVVNATHGSYWGNASQHAGVGFCVGTNVISVQEHTHNYGTSPLVYQDNFTGWTHVVIVYDNHTPKLYVNGVFVRQGLVSSIPNVHASSGHADSYYALVGFGNQNGGSNYDGDIDEIRIYNRVLTLSEIQTLYGDQGWNPNNVPQIPQTLIGASGNQQVNLKWNKVSDSDIRTYRIYRSTTSPAATLVDSVATLNDTTKTTAGLTNGQLYYFRVTAVDSAGQESGFSNEVNATPNNLAPVAVNLRDTAIINTVRLYVFRTFRTKSCFC